MTADNQQERLDPRWVAGFVDGEGCFHVSINKHPRMSTGWQVLPEFRIVQHMRDETILQKLQQFFRTGKVVVNHGDRKELRIRKLRDLDKVVAVFKQYSLRTRKRNNFETFKEILELIKRDEHLKHEGLTRIANMCWTMNRKVKPRFLESSETIRQKSPKKAIKIESDPCSDAGRLTRKSTRLA